MSHSTAEIEFTGEFFVPGQSGKRIEDDHMARYRLGARFVEGLRVLDVACGVGYGSEILMAAGARSYCGVDINPALVRHAAKAYAAPNVSFRQGDVTALGCDNEFDMVTSFETIEHVTDYQGALRGLFAALKPGGRALISSPDRRVTSPRARDLSSRPVNPHHVREFLPAELAGAIEAAGFRLPRDYLWGQRIRPFAPTSWAGKVLKRLRNPEEHASAEPRPLRAGLARYFIIQAIKPD